jgi:hypothetical protein
MDERKPQTTAPPTRQGAPGTPVTRSIATFQHYADAEKAVDALSDRGFPVERVAIVGRDLELVEQVTGRVDYPRAALRGAGAGAVTGVLIGWLFAIFAWIVPLIGWLLLLVYGAVLGAIVGAVFGVIAHALQRGRRDFASVTMTRPRSYELMVDDSVADEALRLLGWER